MGSETPCSPVPVVPPTVVQAPPTLHLGNSPIQTGVLGMGDFTEWLVACCLMVKDGLPEELGVWQPRGGWEELAGRNYWTEHCHILVKEGEAHHIRATTLEGDNMPSSMGLWGHAQCQWPAETYQHLKGLVSHFKPDWKSLLEGVGKDECT